MNTSTLQSPAGQDRRILLKLLATYAIASAIYAVLATFAVGQVAFGLWIFVFGVCITYEYVLFDQIITKMSGPNILCIPLICALTILVVGAPIADLYYIGNGNIFNIPRRCKTTTISGVTSVHNLDIKGSIWPQPDRCALSPLAFLELGR
jgi:hypothetical protein